jgi:hypothetical protein
MISSLLLKEFFLSSYVPDVDDSICVSPPNSDVGETSDSIDAALGLKPGTERKFWVDAPSRYLGEETL